MAEQVRISAEVRGRAALEARDAYLHSTAGTAQERWRETIDAAAPFIDRAARIAVLEELANELDTQVKRVYMETIPGGDVIKDEGWPLYLHYRDVLERIAKLEKEAGDEAGS